MIRDYEILDSENGIVKEIEEHTFTYGDNDLGIYLDPNSEAYKLLKALYEELQKIWEVFKNDNKNDH